MAKKQEIKTEKIEKEYIIPLREKSRHVPRYKKTPKAVKTVKEFLVKHMKIRDRDLKKIKIDRFLNEVLWFRGIRNPPHKIKVKAFRDGEFVRAELTELPPKLKFKKQREEKSEAIAEESIEKKKGFMEKAKEQMKGTPQDSKGEVAPVQEGLQKKEQTEEEKKEEQEKVKAGAEAGEKIKKAAAKTAKHQTGEKAKQPKHPQRKALAK